MRRPLASAALALVGLFLAASLGATLCSAEDAASGVSAKMTLEPSTAGQTVFAFEDDIVVTFHGSVDVSKQSVGRETLKLSVLGTPWEWQITPDSYTVTIATEGFDFQGTIRVPAGTSDDVYEAQIEVAWLSIDGLVRLDAETISLTVHDLPFAFMPDTGMAHARPGGTAAFDVVVYSSPTWSGNLECHVSDVSSVPEVPWLGSVEWFLNATILEMVPGEVTAISLEVVVPTNATDARLHFILWIGIEGHDLFSRGALLSVDIKGVPIAPPPEPAWWENLPVSPWLLLTIVGLSLAVGLVGLLGGTEVGLLSLLWFLLPLFTRLRHREVLNQFTRGEIYGFIKANPGASLTAVRENLGLSNGVVAYHLRVLLREEYVVAHREGGYKRFYPRDMQVPRKRVHFTRLQVDIVDKVRRHPGIGQSELAAMLSESKQVVSYNLKVLVAAGVARVEREGSKARCYLVDGASILAEEEAGAGPEEEAVEVEPEGAGSAPSRVTMRWQ